MFLTISFTLLIIAICGWFIYRYYHSAAWYLSKLPSSFSHYPAVGEKVEGDQYRLSCLFQGKPQGIWYNPAEKTVTIIAYREILAPGGNSSYDEEVRYQLDENGHLLDTQVYQLAGPDGIETGVALTSITAYKPETGHYKWDNPSNPVYLAYFLRQEYSRTRQPGFMAPAPTTRQAHWSGTGYVHINLPGDTLRFKHPFRYYPDKHGYPPAPYYRNNEWGKPDYFMIPGVNFSILTIGFNTGDMHSTDGCYLVVKQ